MIRMLGNSRSTTSACILLLVLSATACGSSSAESTLTNPPDASATSDASSSSPPATGDTVSIDNFAFAPAALSVAAGSAVTWTNDQSVPHTVTADDDSFDSMNLAQNDNFANTFDTPGTFTYHCSIHPDMKGSITVEG